MEIEDGGNMSHTLKGGCGRWHDAGHDRRLHLHECGRARGELGDSDSRSFSSPKQGDNDDDDDHHQWPNPSGTVGRSKEATEQRPMARKYQPHLEACAHWPKLTPLESVSMNLTSV